MELQHWTVIAAIGGMAITLILSVIGIAITLIVGLIGIRLARAQGKPDVSVDTKVDRPSFGTKISAPIIYVHVDNVSSTAVTVRDVQARRRAGWCSRKSFQLDGNLPTTIKPGDFGIWQIAAGIVLNGLDQDSHVMVVPVVTLHGRRRKARGTQLVFVKGVVVPH